MFRKTVEKSPRRVEKIFIYVNLCLQHYVFNASSLNSCNNFNSRRQNGCIKEIKDVLVHRFQVGE